ncbi:MAG: sigma-54 dependent transcriptional regulator, partial [Myxococcota bacterium]
MAKILVVDDNETLREGMAYTIRKMGHQVETASGGMEALSKFVPEQTDFVVTDLKMDHMDGIALLKECRERDPDILVMVVTAFGTIEVAVNAMKEGAFDFITKPFSMELLQAKVQKALDVRFGQRQQQRLLAENQVLRDELEAPYKEQTIVGQGPAMQRVFHLLKKVAASDSTVHIYGESGTGKELIARAIHKQSPRCNGPFIKINCSALTETLLESELFGHEKGAFTNAHRKKLGRFELADQGTIFLDEIGDISPLVQVKLLRVLQERTFERVGGEQPIHVDVRILSATNKDLQQEVDAQRFREDLFYRLHILPLNLPPLRERIEDIEPLVMFFLNKLRTRTLHTVQHVSKESIDLLSVYRWPGNVRELENVLEQTLVFAETET